eukprot:m.63152 g.63152  ORF g.63152 m.63152 type:complete len:556 (+) comp19431_c1_seq2:89-1756(+)
MEIHATENGLDPIPPIAERLRSLQPSQELLQFYRQKILEFDGEHAELVAKLEKYKLTFEEQHKTAWLVAQQREEIAELQRALSDIQVCLFQEREHVLRLYAENDRLKIQELEDRKKIHNLLGLTQPVCHETTYFRNDNDPPIVQPLLRPNSLRTKALASEQHATKTKPSRTRKLNAKQKPGVSRRKNGPSANIIQNDYDADDSFNVNTKDQPELPTLSPTDQVEQLLLQIESLQAQLEDKTRVSNDRIAALEEDRQVLLEEARMTRTKDAAANQDLLDRLHHTQDLLYDSTRDYLELKDEHRKKERRWAEDTEKLLERIEELKDDLDSCHIEIAQAARRAAVPPEIPPLDPKREFRDVGVNAYRPGGRGGRGGRGGGSEGTGNEQQQRQDSGIDPTLPNRSELNRERQQARQREIVQESLADMYREQCIQLEEDLCRLREEREASHDIFGDRTKKLLHRLNLANTRYEGLERRRKLENEGYQNEIKLLKKRCKDLEKQLYKMTLVISTGATDDLQMIHEVHASAKRSKKVVGELQHLKSRVHGAERKVRHLQDHS